MWENVKGKHLSDVVTAFDRGNKDFNEFIDDLFLESILCPVVLRFRSCGKHFELLFYLNQLRSFSE